jgi:hypothetical protein
MEPEGSLPRSQEPAKRKIQIKFYTEDAALLMTFKPEIQHHLLDVLNVYPLSKK